MVKSLISTREEILLLSVGYLKLNLESRSTLEQIDAIPWQEWISSHLAEVFLSLIILTHREEEYSIHHTDISIRVDRIGVSRLHDDSSFRRSYERADQELRRSIRIDRLSWRESHALT